MSITVVQLGGGQGVTGVQVGTGEQVEVVTGIRQPSALDDLTDVYAPAGSSPVDTPLIWRLAPDGIYRLSPLPAATGWGDEVRFAAGVPADADAPPGVWHLDYVTGQLYEKES